MTTDTLAKKERHYGLKIISVLYGTLLYIYTPTLIEKVLGIAMNTYTKTSISLVLATLLCFYFLPKIVGVPHVGSIEENMRAIGLRIPAKVSKHMGLGVLLSICTLSAMLFGSLLTGEYVFDGGTLSLEHIYFSLLPGVFEEIVFRGFLMTILMGLYKDVKKAGLVQCLSFVAFHIGSFDINWLKLIDLLGVFALAVAFTYVAIKSRSLLAGMVFHTLHDAFLFVVQPHQDIVFSPVQALLFYGVLLFLPT